MLQTLLVPFNIASAGLAWTTEHVHDEHHAMAGPKQRCCIKQSCERALPEEALLQCSLLAAKRLTRAWPVSVISGMLHLQQKTHYHSGMQAYLVVRSFAEKEAYMYSSWYARVANKEYADDVSASQTEWERHFTVACYDDDPKVSSRQVTTLLCL